MFNLFVLSSVIHPKYRPLSYSSVSSAFSETERYNQTINTVKSIHQYANDAHVLWIEAGVKNVYSDEIKSLGIDYAYVWNYSVVRWFVDGKFKGIWESILLFFGTLWLDISNYDFIYKISWRYQLNQFFDQETIQKKSMFSFLTAVKSYSTRLYCFDKKLYYIWKFYLCLFSFLWLSNASIELMWYYLLPKHFVHPVKILWVQGEIWVNWDMVSE